jgi:hypothetical protein
VGCLPPKLGILCAESPDFKGLISLGIAIESGSSKSESSSSLSSLTLLDGLAGFLAGCFLGGGLSGLSSSDSSESKSSS